jgi:SAM-dependent methyltransferase
VLTVKKVKWKFEKIKKKLTIFLSKEERLESMVGPFGAWKATRNFQYTFLTQHGLKPQHRFLDIGCGPLRGGYPVIEYLDKGCYTGIDIRQEAIEIAKKQIKKGDLIRKQPTLIISDSFGKNELKMKRFDIIWCFQVFYHLESDILETCLAQISNLLDQNGICYANVNTTLKDGSWMEFPFIKRSVECYSDLAAKYGLQTQVLGQLADYDYPDFLKGRSDYLLLFRKGEQGKLSLTDSRLDRFK